MKNTPTDRGIAFILENANGTKNVYVAAAASAANAPQDVFAMHVSRTTVKMDPSVRTIPAGTMSRTTEPVHVSADQDGVVHILSHTKDFGPLMK
jgi:hypothetical protein